MKKRALKYIFHKNEKIFLSSFSFYSFNLILIKLRDPINSCFKLNEIFCYSFIHFAHLLHVHFVLCMHISTKRRNFAYFFLYYNAELTFLIRLSSGEIKKCSQRRGNCGTDLRKWGKLFFLFLSFLPSPRCSFTFQNIPLFLLHNSQLNTIGISNLIFKLYDCSFF